MDRLDELLLEWEDRRARGEQVDVATLCPDTELRPELAERIRMLEAFAGLMAFADPPLPSPIPEQIGKYKVTRKLGAGGMGVVYEATDPVLERTVAVKVLKTDSSRAPTRRAVEGFMREVRILGRFARKSIVVAYEAGESDGLPYLVMDYLPNGSLATHQKRLTEAGPGAVAALMEKVARGVQDAHSIGVLHRDLKPSNVLLDEEGVPFIADFGLAAVLATGAAPLTAPAGQHGDANATTLRGVGTPPYMAPEQFAPSFGPVGTPTDVWALGVILFELLTGRRPFAPTATETLREQILAAPVPPMPGVPKALAAVVRVCLERRPTDRFQTAGQLADALHAVQAPSRRTVLRRAALGGAAVLGCTAPVAVWTSDPYRRFRWQTSGHLAALEKGRPVELIEPGGAVPKYYLRTGAGTTQVGMSEEGLVARSTTFALVELLPALPASGCELVFEVRHDSDEFGPGSHSCLGLFFAAARAEHEGMIHHLLGYVTFNDHEPRPSVALGAVWHSELPPGADGVLRGPEIHIADSRRYPPVIALPRPLPFRTLQFRLRADETRLMWQGPPQHELEPFRATHRTAAIEAIEEARPGLGAKLRQDFSPRLGIFVVGGRITVRKLRVVPAAN